MVCCLLLYAFWVLFICCFVYMIVVLIACVSFVGCVLFRCFCLFYCLCSYCLFVVGFLCLDLFGVERFGSCLICSCCLWFGYVLGVHLLVYCNCLLLLCFIVCAVAGGWCFVCLFIACFGLLLIIVCVCLDLLFGSCGVSFVFAGWLCWLGSL